MNLKCQEVIEFLWAYLANELPPERAQAFEEHLSLCPGCVVYLDTYRQAVELTQGAWGEDEDAEGQFPEDLLQAILAARKEE